MYLIWSLMIFFLMFFPDYPGRTQDLHARITEAAETVLSNRYTLPDTHLEVRVVRTGGDIGESGPLELFWPDRPEVPKALLRVNIHSQVGHSNRQEGWALLYIAHFDSVLVANRSIKNSEGVLESDVSTIWAETTRFHGNPLSPESFRQLAKQGDIYSNRYLSEKKILKENDLRNAYDVDTGQQVIMHYNRNGISLELTCKSRNRGFKGDLIKLFSPDTQHTYKARITASQTATWVETLK